ncbi:hypothetical protein QNO07_09530 [Streptomyces sp. 549]|uniref:hypothetical protein n=1 Tax=Streptomyces sp. 549 TaxID=3049076 RepID=UPI0024C291CA|nr:hypothetical protein [Streptomyces sp. 549]MDK1473660.1 hypothetical protein [Streptomyces sp. 549]
MDHSPADTLRDAAARLRTLAGAVPADHWGDRPWHVEECSDTDTMQNCPCIVTQGEYRAFDEPQDPPIQYVADAETPEHAAYIAAMHPGVGLALATWLEHSAVILSGYDNHDHAEEYGHLPLAVARAVLGSGPDADTTGAGQ